ncbi:MAG: hypothetical protein WA708_19135 [Acidobacteriaceae bacterium]
MSKVFKSLGRLLIRSARVVPKSLGSTWLGLFFFPALIFGVTFALTIFVKRGQVMTLLRDAGFSLVVTFAALVVVYLGCIAVTIYREHNALSVERDQTREVLTPLQFEGFKLAAEIREFALSFGALDGPPPQAEARFRKAVWEHLQEWIGSYPPELDAQIRLKLIHGFETRKFGERVGEYMHQVGESGYPIFNASGFTEGIFDRRSLCRLAADIEIVAISTNHFPSPRKLQNDET